MRRNLFLAVLLTALAVVPCFAGESKTIPVTTKSSEAARLYQEGIQLQGNVRTGEAVEKWRAAVKADPNFAMAWAMIAASESSPAAAVKAREKARLLAPKATPGEKMMIHWIVSRGESDAIAAIAAANDLVAKYPEDKYVLSVVGSWLAGMNEWDRGILLQEKALALDPKYAPALNEAGYVYAHQRNFGKAVDAMQRYTELIPNEPNPQDSYAEILRLAGRFDEALVHYREALKIMPTFYSSQLGLGDTYALMGDQERARAEYAKCSDVPDALSVSIPCRQMSAYSYIRENNFKEARKQLQTFTSAMLKEGQTQFAVDAMMAQAFINKDATAATADLDRAAAAIRSDRTVPKANRDETMARIMAHKVRVAALAGEAATAQKAYDELAAFAKNTSDPLIQAALSGGHGALLFAQKKYEAAVAQLQDDSDDAFSKMLLVKTYLASGNEKAAAELKDSVLTLRRLEIDLWMAQQALKS